MKIKTNIMNIAQIKKWLRENGYDRVKTAFGIIPISIWLPWGADATRVDKWTTSKLIKTTRGDYIDYNTEYTKHVRLRVWKGRILGNMDNPALCLQDLTVKGYPVAWTVFKADT
jgi:hypothetical protein